MCEITVAALITLLQQIQKLVSYLQKVFKCTIIRQPTISFFSDNKLGKSSHLILDTY